MAKSKSARQLVAAIKAGDVETASSVIDDGADMGALVNDIPAIGWAVYENQPEILRLLLSAGCNADTPQDDGTTPLQSCSSIRSDQLPEKDAIVLAQLLLEHGADVMAHGNNHDYAPLAMAKLRGKKKLAKVLVSHGARAFNVVISMKDDNGKPLTGEFYYGVPDGEHNIEDVPRSGKLKMENVFPGLFIVGYEGDECVVTINEDETVTPAEIQWSNG